MAESYFPEKATVPDERQLHTALQKSSSWWDAFIEQSGGVGEWKFYTKTAGWVFQVKQGKHTARKLLKIKLEN